MQKERFETLFLTMLELSNGKYIPYAQMYDNNGFGYCIGEIKHCLDNEISGKGKSNNSKHFINNFYKFMLSDRILKDIDELTYRNVLLKLKKYTEGESASKKEQYAFFNSLGRRFGYKYYKKVYSIIIDIYKNETVSEDSCVYYAKIFISELLASGLTYSFLGYIANKYRNNEFESFEKLIDYLFYANEDTIDIFLPIKEFKTKDIKYFEKHNQKIELKNEKYYCKIYQNNRIDFFYAIRQNIMRIDSIFNVLRLYTNSQIDFDYNEDVIIISKYFKTTESKPFSTFIKYGGIRPYYKHLDNTVDNFYKLKDNDIQLYHKLLNTISYAKKDKDIIEQRSFVNNWISLESLCALCERKEGFEAVTYIVPKTLVAKIICNDITFLLKESLWGEKQLKLESFLDKLWKNELDLSCIKNPYYAYCLKQYCETLKDFNSLESLFKTIEYNLYIDILRIYMLRNEYVHESNLQAFQSMQYHKLKNILQMMLDEFFKNLSLRMDRDNSLFGCGFEAFNIIIEKYELRNTAFNVVNDKNLRIKSKNLQLTMNFDDIGIDPSIVILNILKGNIDLFKQYLSNEDYKNKQD